MTARIVGGTADTKTSGGITQAEIFDFQRLYGNSILIDETNGRMGIFTSASTYTLRVGGTFHANSSISTASNISATGSITTNGTIGNINQSNFRGNDLQINGTATVGGVATNGTIGNANQANFRGNDIVVNGGGTFGSVNTGSGAITSTGTIGVANNTNFRGNDIVVNGIGSFGNTVSGTSFLGGGIFGESGSISTASTQFRGRLLTVRDAVSSGSLSTGDISSSGTITTTNTGATHDFKGSLIVSSNGLYQGTLRSNGRLQVDDFINAESYIRSNSYITSNSYIQAEFFKDRDRAGRLANEFFMFKDGGNEVWLQYFTFTNPFNNLEHRYEFRFQNDGNALAYRIDYGGVGGLTRTVTALGPGTASDARLKENISALDTKETLKKVLETPIVNFDWIDDGSKEFEGRGREAGFLAQDIEHIWPEIVYTTTDTRLSGDRKNIDKDRLVPMAFAAIQELKKQLDEAKEEIKDLRNRI